MIHRDQKTGALVNKDVNALNKYKAERKQYKKIESLSGELEEVKKCLSDIQARLEKIES